MEYTQLATPETLTKAAAALRDHGFDVHTVADGAGAKAKVLELIPEGSSVLAMTSMTLEAIGVTPEINDSGRYQSVRAILNSDADKKQKTIAGSTPQYTVGSVHAVTEQGEVLIASNTGSQLPAYAYGAEHVVWVIGTQKLVPDVSAGLKRIYEHSLPLESARARVAYGVEASSVNKILIVNREIVPGRIHIIFVEQVLGY